MLIPTTGKQRLPPGFSYPLGAEQLSGCLARVPQFADLRISFSHRAVYWSSDFRRTLADGSSYEIINVPAEPAGTIHVYAVQSYLRQFARRALVSSGLPSLRSWMTEHWPPDPLRPALCRVMFTPSTTTVFLRERVARHERDLTP